MFILALSLIDGAGFTTLLSCHTGVSPAARTSDLYLLCVYRSFVMCSASIALYSTARLRRTAPLGAPASLHPAVYAHTIDIRALVRCDFSGAFSYVTQLGLRYAGKRPNVV